MVNSSVQTPNRKRKSQANIGVECPQFSKKAKLNGGMKPHDKKNYTSVKNTAPKGEISKKGATRNTAKTPKRNKRKGKKRATSGRKGMKKFSGTSQLKDFNEKIPCKLENEASLKESFSGTCKLEDIQIKKENSCEVESGGSLKKFKIEDIKKETNQSENEASPTSSQKERHQQEAKAETDSSQSNAKVKQRKVVPYVSRVLEKCLNEDPSMQIQFLEDKIERIKSFPERSKKGERNLRKLMKFKRKLLRGESAPPITSQNEEQHQQEAKAQTNCSQSVATQTDCTQSVAAQESYVSRVKEKCLNVNPSLRIQFLEDEIKRCSERFKEAQRNLRQLLRFKKSILLGEEPAPLTTSLKKGQYQQQAEDGNLKLASKQTHKRRESS